MGLGVWHRIVDDSDSKPAKYNHWFWSDSDFDNFDLNPYNFDLFWLEDQFKDGKSQKIWIK